jgi:DNA polymerase III subunit delta
VTFDSIIADLKSKRTHPIYFFYGDEPYYIDKLVDYIEDNVLDETAKAFNQFVVYGKDIDAKYIIDGQNNIHSWQISVSLL